MGKNIPTIPDVLKNLRLSVSNYDDDEEVTTEKHQIWSLKKILVLHDYIKPFLTIIRNNNYKTIHYFDPFSGTGFLKIKGKIMPGTPLIPLLVTRELVKDRDDLYFDTVNYSDNNKKSLVKLEARANNLKNNLKTKIHVEHNLFRTVALTKFKDVPPLPQKKYDDAYLVVLDPYGFDVEWRYLERILKNGAVDVILTFPSELANWTKTMENSKEKLTKMFGGEEYQNFYTADEFLQEYCKRIENIPLQWSVKIKSITVEAGKQTYHLICISRSKGALSVFSSMQTKYGNLSTQSLEGFYNSALGNTLEKFFAK